MDLPETLDWKAVAGLKRPDPTGYLSTEAHHKIDWGAFVRTYLTLSVGIIGNRLAMPAAVWV